MANNGDREEEAVISRNNSIVLTVTWIALWIYMIAGERGYAFDVIWVLGLSVILSSLLDSLAGLSSGLPVIIRSDGLNWSRVLSQCWWYPVLVLAFLFVHQAPITVFNVLGYALVLALLMELLGYIVKWVSMRSDKRY